LHRSIPFEHLGRGVIARRRASYRDKTILVGVAVAEPNCRPKTFRTVDSASKNEPVD
jgi:hypothetical protein